MTSTFYFLPNESELYLKSDILKLRNFLLPISIVLSIIFAFLLVFDRTEYNGGKWSKAMYILYIGMMSYLAFSLTSDLLTTIALKTNRTANNQTLDKNFVISTITVSSNGEIVESEPWVIESENKYEVRGRISGKTYDKDVDGIYMDENDYAKISQKKEFAITLQKGLYGILYKPTLKE